MRACRLLLLLAVALDGGWGLSWGEKPCAKGCIDYYGLCRGAGEAWVEDETWSYKCEAEGASPTFLGCRGRESSSDVVGVGEEKSVDGFWRRCEATSTKLRYSEEPFCERDGGRVHVGDRWAEGVFERSCEEWGVGIVGCWVEAGPEGEPRELLRIGESLSRGLVSHHCRRLTQRRIQYFTSLPRRKSIIAAQGRSRNAHLPPPPSSSSQDNQPQPQDILNFLPTPPPPYWRQETAAFHVHTANQRFWIKIRYLN